MPAYSKTTWIDGSAPAIDATNLNKIEQGIFDSLRQDGSTTMSGQLVTTAGSAATPAIAPTGDSNTGIFFPAADNVALAVGGGEGFRLLANGNVGISQANPSVRLSLGSATGQKFNVYDEPTSGIGIGMGIDISGIGSYETTFYSKSNAGGNGQWTWGHLNSSNTFSEKMRITSAGNVGIGTTSPTEKLQVNATSGNVGLNINTADAGAVSYLSLSNTGASGKRYSLNVGGNTIGSGLSNNLFLYDNDNAAVRFLITPSGNVGIGTTNPSSILHISSATASYAPSLTITNTGTGSDQQSVIALYTDNATTTNQFLIGKNSVAGGADTFLSNQANSAMIFETNALARMRITAAGYLLIGYTSSNGAYPLQVNGQIFATSSTIATSDGRYKKDVVALDGALDIVKALNPVQFSWKDHPVHKFNTDVPTVGFIAQEVEQALADKSYLTSIIKKSECTWETETGETVEREVTRDVEKQVTREVEREVTETIDGEEVTRTVTEEITETVIEQVTEIVTEPVKETHTEEFLGIAESNLIAILTKAVKELNAKVEALEAQLNK